nr:hypothetical protein [uncultured Pseudodesulfovibrio sp.]
MPLTNNVLTVLWWGGYTILGIWGQRTIPGIDFFAAGLILSLQKEERPSVTISLIIIWILLLEGTGNLPFGYGLAWYGLITTLYFMGQWLFEARSFLFMALLGLGLGVLHPILINSVSSLANLHVPFQPLLIEGAMQAGGFFLIWLVIDHLYPQRLRHNVKSL